MAGGLGGFLARIVLFPLWHAMLMQSLGGEKWVLAWLAGALALYFIAFSMVWAARDTGEIAEGVLASGFFLLIALLILPLLPGRGKVEAASVVMHGWLGSLLYGLAARAIAGPAAPPGEGEPRRAPRVEGERGARGPGGLAAPRRAADPPTREALDCYTGCVLDCARGCPRPLDREGLGRARECRAGCLERCRVECGA